jgi:uncharacterized protein YfaS (alpha-2-macroglobulin family)
MKKLPWKKLAIGAMAVGIIAFGIFYFTTSKGKKPTSSFIDPAFSEYITSYTAGVVASNASIKIMFSRDAVDSTLIGQESSVNLFDFSPNIKGKTVWVDKRMVEFRPDGRLTSGQVYEVSFKLSKLMEVPPTLKNFEYSFQVMPQNFEINIDNIKPYVKTELTRQKVEGTLLTADFADGNAVEKMMEASQEGKGLKVTWQHNGEGKQHIFVIEEVARKEAASSVKISANGKSLGVDNTVTKEVEVPSLNDFKLMNAKVVQNPNQYVILQFSDPLKEKQELEGLIAIGEKALSLDFDIHDNEIWVYPAIRQAGTQAVRIEAGVRNINDYKMKEASSTDVVFEQLKPEVRFTGNGTILPSSDGLILPFEAVNLKSVDVTVKKVFENNILQFLQVNKIDGENEWHRVGKRVLKKTIQLDNTGITDLGKWNRYTLDLAQLINAEPGAIYEIQISFKKAYSSYACEGEEAEEAMTVVEDDTDDDPNEGYREYYYEEGEYYYDEDYDWEERDNPCNSSFYSSRRNIRKNILASDLGLLAKCGDGGSTTIVVNDIKTTQPLSGVTLEFYDFQQQLLGALSTGADGTAVFSSKAIPFAVIAKSGAQRGYLRLVDGESLSLSGFDVSGEYVAKGLKGFIYGDRGVWRPGDSLYLNFLLEDKNKTLPSSHPVVFELQNPQGVVTNRLVRSTGENGFYKFATATSEDAPTGNWMARIKVGGTEFSQTVKIETIKPNRLKINLDVGGEKIVGPAVNGKLNVKWLHGAPGKNLKAQFEVSLVPQYTTFPKYDEYVFEEPSRYYNTTTQPVFEGSTDEDGNATFTTALEKTNTPGFMTAVFRGKVFEESGNFSTDRFSVSYYPYLSYAGLKPAAGERYTGMLYTDTIQNVNIVFLDTNGKPVDRTNADVTLYKLNRYWWWDNSSSSVVNYIEQNSSALYSAGKVNTVNGKATWSFKAPTADWGTFYIRTCDPVSGHCTGKMIYMDQRGYYGRYSRDTEEKGGVTRLNFTADKAKYNVGEKINLTIPSSAQGRALISIENGSKVLKTLWQETTQGDTKLAIEVTADMTPNIFLSITLLQPHAQTANDLPIRMYGIIPIGVEDPATHLEPVITMPEEIQPGQEITIKVSEKAKRKMTFTLAMVDEGLLDITKFKTPEPWKRFYAREALGVKTWDVYDQVMGAFGGRIERLLAVGGDGEMEAKEEDPRANRFKPVVKFFGPITIDAGDDKEIKFTMPQYIGSVKTMVVAGYEGAYGNAENVTPVRKPLMVLATLPRVLGPEEIVKLPVTLFTQDKRIKNVKVDVKVSGPLSLTNGASQNVSMSASGDLTINFDLAVKSETGVGKVIVTASSGQHQSSDEIEIDIRNPNPPITQATEMFLEAGKSWNNAVTPVGVAGTNSATLEVSTLPPINLGYRLHYLIEYPHGCIEQTTSAAFPQLYLDVVKVLNDPEKARIKYNITHAIERLKMFITRDGGFGYWPGHQESDSWGTTYAGHFLIEAESKGYFIPSDMIKRWKKYQRTKAVEWRRGNTSDYWYHSTDLNQAYRLYTLALAGAAELGAMNRLRELTDLPVQAKWMLAAAYAKAGQVDAAKKMVANLTTEIKPYQELAYTYGSDLRDKAIILETLILLNERTKGFELLKVISKSLSNQQYWMSTQTVSFCLKAVGMFASVEKRGDMAFSYTFNGKTMNASSVLPLAQVPLALKGVQPSAIKINNDSKGSLFIRVITTGTPARGKEEDGESALVISTRYTDAKSNIIDPTKLEQGTEFLAQVSVKNPGLRGEYKNMALTQIFPSGWEINNLRITDDETTKNYDRGDYQDIRDDRVYTYFYLNGGQTRTFNVMLTASYVGQFYLPAISCEAMYDNSIYARKKGQPVEVVRTPENQ